jgi:hypothetical protein
MEQSSPAEDQRAPSHWIVICPETYIPGGVWARWYRENCVAVGWPPPKWSFDSSNDGRAKATPFFTGWKYARTRLEKIRDGDKVIPFLLQWRVGPVGTVRHVKVTDAEWNPTVEGNNGLGKEPTELGRRILVTWDQADMPPDGKCALVPPDQRTRGALATHTIEGLRAETFQRLCAVLANRSNWIDIPSGEFTEKRAGRKAAAG